MSRFMMCPNCGHRMSRVYDSFGTWTGNYECDHCSGEYGEDECLSASDASDMWMSSGMDEDYMFGYSEDELMDEL